MELPKLRQQIDAIDSQIVALLNERLKLAADVGQAKAEEGREVFAPDREHELLQRLIMNNAGFIPDSALLSIYREILSASRSRQKQIAVAYLGDPGSLAHSTAREFFGSSAYYYGFDSLRQLCESVDSGECDCGVADTVPGEGFSLLTALESQLIPGNRFCVFRRNRPGEAPVPETQLKQVALAAAAATPALPSAARPVAEPVPPPRRSDGTGRLYALSFLLVGAFLGAGWWFSQKDAPPSAAVSTPGAVMPKARDSRLTFRLDAQGYVVDPELWLLKPVQRDLEALQLESARLRTQGPLELKALEDQLEAARAKVNVTQNAASDLKTQRETSKASLATNSTEKKAKLDAIWTSSQKRLASEFEQRRADFVALVKQRASEAKLTLPPVEKEEPELFVSALRMSVFTLPKNQQDTNLLLWADAAFADFSQREEEARADQENIRKQVESTRVELDRVIQQDQLLVDTLLIRHQQAEADYLNAKLALEKAEGAVREKRDYLARAPKELREKVQQTIEGAKQMSLLPVADNVWQKADLAAREDLMGDRAVCLRAQRFGTNYWGLIPVKLAPGTETRASATEEIFQNVDQILEPRAPAEVPQ